MKKKILLVAGLAVLVLAQALVAWNARLCWRARAVVADPQARLKTLRRAEAVFPWNDEVAYELGRVHALLATEAPGDAAARDRSFDRAVGAFLRSLRLNPGSAEAHFELAQTLLYMSFLGRPTPVGPFEEYKKAAELTSSNSELRYEVGKVLLGRWDALGAEEKRFAAGLLKGSLAGSGEERLRDFLEAWNLAGRDLGLADEVLPEDASALRTFARFLGERGLALEARQSALSRAEAMEVATARTELDQARREAESYRLADATARASAALEALGSVRFYQDLAGAKLFDPADFEAVRTGARRLLAMNRIEETRSLADADGVTAAYLAAESDFTALSEFETFLKERGLLDEAASGSPFRDLRTLAFRMGLDFKLNRYRDIARIGGLLASSSVVIAPSGRASYAAILRLIGEADLKLDNVYEAERYYRLAEEAEPDNLAVLLGLERCYNRLNEEARAAEVRTAIARLTSPAEIDLGGRVVAKGETIEIPLVTSGGPRTVRLAIGPGPDGRPPLVSVLLDGRVTWEKIGDTGQIEFSATFKPGRSSLEIAAVSDAVRLGRLTLVGGEIR